MKRIIFYTAGLVPTADEQAALNKFEAAAVAPFDVIVGSAYAPAQSIPIRAGDYRYGATPAGYAALPVADPDAPPTGLPATSAVVKNGDVLTFGASKYTFTVAGGVVTNIVQSAV